MKKKPVMSVRKHSRRVRALPRLESELDRLKEIENNTSGACGKESRDYLKMAILSKRVCISNTEKYIKQYNSRGV